MHRTGTIRRIGRMVSSHRNEPVRIAPALRRIGDRAADRVPRAGPRRGSIGRCATLARCPTPPTSPARPAASGSATRPTAERPATARRVPGPDDRRRDRQARARLAVEALLPRAARRALDRLRHRQRREPRGRHGPDRLDRRRAVRARRRRHHVAATTSGTSARSTRRSSRTTGSCGRSTTARRGVPGRGWGTYHALDGTDLAVINLQGRTYMQPIENPFLEADRAARRGRRAAAAGPARRLPLRDHVREERDGRPPRRARLGGRGDAHPRAHRRRPDPARAAPRTRATSAARGGASASSGSTRPRSCRGS